MGKVKVHETNKLPYLALGLRLWKIANNLYFLWKWSNAVAVNMVAEKIQFWCSKKALRRVDDDSMSTQTFKYQS